MKLKVKTVSGLSGALAWESHQRGWFVCVGRKYQDGVLDSIVIGALFLKLFPKTGRK